MGLEVLPHVIHVVYIYIYLETAHETTSRGIRESVITRALVNLSIL